MIHQANSYYNKPPKDGYEYMLVRITFEYLKGTDPNAQYDLSRYKFTAVSTDGRDYDSYLFVDSPKPELKANLYPGAAFEGWVPFEINTFDKTPLLTFGRDYVGRGGLWWKLYQ